MTKMKNIIMGIVPFLLITACSPKLTPFSQRLADEYNWSELELKRIQFYLSDDVVLTRIDNRGHSEIVDGKIRDVDGRKIDQIIIRKKTPGVLIFIPKEDRYAISFEDNDQRFLMFGPNPKSGGRYVLLAKDWDRRKGKVTYGDRLYVTNLDSAFSTLMVDLKKVNKVAVRTRIAEGRKVN